MDFQGCAHDSDLSGIGVEDDVDFTLGSQQELVRIFEGLTSENYSTLVQAVKTWLEDAQRSSVPLAEESNSMATSLSSFIEVCLRVQQEKICQRRNCRHYSYHTIAIDETVVAAAVAVCSITTTAIHFHCSLQSWPPETQYHLPSPIDL